MDLSRRHFFFGSLALPALAAKKAAPERPNVVLWSRTMSPNGSSAPTATRRSARPTWTASRRSACDFWTASPPRPPPPRAAPACSPDARRCAPPQAKGHSKRRLPPPGYVCAAGDAGNAPRHIDAAAPGKPIFLTVNLTSPRAPYEGVAQKYRDMYAQTKFDTFSPDPAAANARAGKEMLADTIGSLRKYAAALTALDDEVQSVLARIQQRKLVDQTLVVFTSTCGALLSHHGLWDAGEASQPANMYEESVATPLILSWPLRVPPQVVRPEIVSAYDLVPTLCDLLEHRSAGG